MGRLTKWLAKKGNVGGVARWATSGYTSLRQLAPEHLSDQDIFRSMIEIRYKTLPNEKYETYLISKSNDMEGLMGLVIEVLKIETPFSETSQEAKNEFLDIIEEELVKSSLPENILFGQNKDRDYWLQAWTPILH